MQETGPTIYSPIREDMDGMLVHGRFTPSIKFGSTHLYTRVERGTVRVKCLAWEHKTQQGLETQNAWSRAELTNLEATLPPSVQVRLYYSCGHFLLQDEDSLCNKLCTFTMTQKEFMNQHWYHCHTCKMNDGVGVCTVCAKVCHKDHDISYAKYGSFFCDCGAKEDGSCIVS